jgi:RimJ/RimL family protein N-acetyltransferase
MMTVRKTVAADMKCYFEWANDESVRSNAFNTDPIAWETHCDWFELKLKDKNSYLYVAEDDGQALGQIRFDIDEDEAEISYSIDAAYRGRGLGVVLLEIAIKSLAQERMNIKSILAKVKTENVPSKRIFQKLGFEEEQVDKFLLYTLRLT